MKTGKKMPCGFNPLKVSALTSIKPVTNDMPLKVMRLTLFKFN